MTAEEMWREYVDTLDVGERFETIDEFYKLRTNMDYIHEKDVTEYQLLLRAGKVAPMPDMKIWG